MKILAVDDDATFLALLESVLKDAGYDEVDVAHDAEEALGRINQADTPYECFLLDICMPVVNGISLCSRIRANPAHRFTPILMLTARLDEASIDAAFKAGASDYVTKPLKGLELGARIRTAYLLCEQMRKASGLEKSAEALQSRLDSLQRESLADPLDLDERSQCISQRDLENALCLLPKKVFALSVFAFRIEGIEELFRDLSHDSFRDALSEAAMTIARRIAPQQHYICYSGDGVFGCVTVGGGRRRSDVSQVTDDMGSIVISGQDQDPRHIHLSSYRVSDLPIQSGSCAVDALRTAVARMSESSLMHRLQRDLDRDRLGSGRVIPRRPRLGLKTRATHSGSQIS